MRDAEEPPPAKASYALGSWLFLRALGLVLLAAFLSADVQLDGLIGEDGLFPASFWLDDLRAQGAGFWSAPSLAWLGSSNAALHGICYAGVVAALFLIAGRMCIPALVVSFASYLSIVNVGASFFAYQWDALLLETCLVAIPLAALWRRKWRDGTVSTSALPRYALYFLNWRLVFCSGVVKLGGPTWRDLSALDYHYWTQPLPGPLSWYVHHLPDWFQATSVVGVLFIELVVPWGLFVPGKGRRVAALILIALQCAFLLTGNFGFFNFLAISLCLPALDDSFWRRRLPARFRPTNEAPRKERGTRVRQALAGALMALALVPTAGTLFGWRHMPAPLGNAFVAIAPLRLVSSYGLFARMTRERIEFIYEGTRDGETWLRYEFESKPDMPRELPSQSAPHLPRLDWGLWFAALGHPSYEPLVHELQSALERAEPDVLELLRRDPFGGERPRAVRVRRVRQRFSSWRSHSARGEYWDTEEE